MTLPFIIKISNNSKNNIIKQAFPFLLAYFFCLLCIIIRLLFNQGQNIEFLLSFLKSFILFLSVVFVILVFFERKLTSSFIYTIILIYTFNALVNFFIGSNPDFYTYIEPFQGKVISDNLGDLKFRNSFISGSGYFSIGTAYGLIIILLSFYMKEKINNKSFLIFFIIISITGILAARVSMFAIIPALFYLFKSKASYLFYFILLLYAIVYILLIYTDIGLYENWIYSFFELKNDASGNQLINEMYFWPGVDIFLYGKGFVNDGSFPYTDAGYMQDILFGGVIFLLLKLSFLGIFAYSLFRKFPLVTVLFCFAVLTFHFKGLFLYNNAQGMAAFFFIYFYLMNVKTEQLSA
jgi:hypothetical protein